MKNRYLSDSIRNKKTWFLAAFIFSSIVFANAQYITIHERSIPIINGVASPGEWDDADSLIISLSAGTDVIVKYKHDGSNFYFAYFKFLESNSRFPEVLMDINNAKSVGWEGDDWWFHVSATDCESNTAANDYSNCQAVQPGWTGANNFAAGLPITDTVEIAIPFAKVNFISTVTDTIGILFDVTNTFNAWNFWPATGINMQSPATWGNAIIEFLSTGIQKHDLSEEHFSIYPSPASEFVRIKSKGIGSDCSLKLLNSSGQLIGTKNMISTGNSETEFSLVNLAAGIYLVLISDGVNHIKKTFFKAD